MNTYYPIRGKKNEVGEETLDCPLVDLDLIRKVGERTPSASTQRESVYSFNVDNKPTISPRLFVYCLNEFWNSERPNEKTLTMHDVAYAYGSPGQVFKLSESSIRDRLDNLSSASDGKFDYQEFASMQQILRREGSESLDLMFVYD